MTDPTSWYMIEPGWDVVDADGERVGEVIAVVGDQDADIFDGLRIETAGGDELYVVADRVADLVDGRVALDVPQAGLDVEDVEEPGGAEITRDRDVDLDA
jgi:PRC-barrel domain